MHCVENNLTSSFVRFERPYNSPRVAFRWNRVAGTFQMNFNKCEVKQSGIFPLGNQYSSISKCFLPLKFAWSHGGQATQGRAAWGPLGAGVRGTAAALLLSLHFALAEKMLKVNGEIPLGMFGSLELLGNQWLWRAKTQARKIVGQIHQISTTKQMSTWRAITLLIHELGLRSPWLPVGWCWAASAVCGEQLRAGALQRGTGPSPALIQCSTWAHAHSSWSTLTQNSPSTAKH